MDKKADGIKVVDLEEKLQILIKRIGQSESLLSQGLKSSGLYVFQHYFYLLFLVQRNLFTSEKTFFMLVASFLFCLHLTERASEKKIEEFLGTVMKLIRREVKKYLSESDGYADIGKAGAARNRCLVCDQPVAAVMNRESPAQLPNAQHTMPTLHITHQPKLKVAAYPHLCYIITISFKKR